ncbi:PrsW family intramembrane metalloprotease [Patescibacteria group bacterium]|nr:PrsW family intramembrane metalloprotease [Patescibacteria group bacterium]
MYVTLLAFLTGLLPALVWLWFWLKQDAQNPEPKKRIFFTFVAGMLTALTVIVFQISIINYTVHYSAISLLLLASSEEILKYIFAYYIAIRKKVNDEPIDAVIYMITVALGFAAMENILYLWSIFNEGDFIKGIIVGNTRFMGATVLHTVSSGIVGVAIASSFYRNKSLKRTYLFIGLILSIALHTSFNLFIIKTSGGEIFNIFIYIWIAIMILLLLIEKIKKLKKNY